jgi:mono/diheme cytochrome c family protein
VAPDGTAWAGGYAIETRFGTFYGPNLTQDPATGIGGWTAADFARAIRVGRDREGHALWPAFPYPSYTGLTDADIADLWAFFGTIPAVVREPAPHDTRVWRGWLGLWRMMNLRRGPADPEDRGAYLGTAVAHCGECHTPRGPTGGLRHRRELTGNGDPPAPAPDITGLGWDAYGWATFLEDGTTPDDDVVGGEMRRVIRGGTSLLSEDDRASIGAWVEGLPVRRKGPDPATPDP